MNNRLVTTKQKKFIEKTCGALGINIDEMMEINNLSKIIKAQNDLFEIILKQGEQITQLKKEINDLQESVRILSQSKIDDMWKLFVNGSLENQENEANG